MWLSGVPTFRSVRTRIRRQFRRGTRHCVGWV